MSSDNDTYGSYISQLNLLTPIALVPDSTREKNFETDLESWSNAQFIDVSYGMGFPDNDFEVSPGVFEDQDIVAQPTMMVQSDLSTISNSSQLQPSIYPIFTYPAANSIMTARMRPISIAPAVTTTLTSTSFSQTYPISPTNMNEPKEETVVSPKVTTDTKNYPSHKNSTPKMSQLTSGDTSKKDNNDSKQSPDPEVVAKLAAEEDKRKRNTAASARFRVKKKMREQALERTAKEMTSKAEAFESRIKELEMEVKWLRSLIVEKDARLLDIDRPGKKHKTESESQDAETNQRE
ncbi:33982_t:CDS:1 [Gigaspora margarita]|uniref:33982_t:CDS:1 n=2 Tax=Gigaspora margarita TaxID=4874 RepID=A0ABN7VFB2_GIGMA|nr:Regulatory cys-3 protein [Gigaspora margarita]CAG8761164.1 33982_t:CDS:1 [Gigaspora margarita]